MTCQFSLLGAVDADPWQKWRNVQKLRNQRYFLLSLKVSQLFVLSVIF